MAQEKEIEKMCTIVEEAEQRLFVEWDLEDFKFKEKEAEDGEPWCVVEVGPRIQVQSISFLLIVTLLYY